MVRRLVVSHVFTQMATTTVVLCIVCKRNGSNGRHFHFPEIIIEADTYQLLMKELQVAVPLDSTKWRIDIPTHVSLPLSTSQNKNSPYVPSSIYFIWKQDSTVELISLAESTVSSLSIKFTHAKEKNSTNAQRLLKALNCKRSPRSIEKMLLKLLSPVLCVEEWQTFVFIYSGTVTKIESGGRLCLRLKQKTDCVHRNTVKSKTKLYLMKNIEVPTVKPFHSHGPVPWTLLFNNLSECYRRYFTIAPAIEVEGTEVAENIVLPFAGIFWLKVRSVTNFMLPVSYIHGDNLELCEAHNRLVTQTANLCGEFRNVPHPLLSLMANESIVGPIIYAFYSDTSVRSANSDLTVKEVCAFFISCLERFLGGQQ
ncbi:hypothetical protein HDE_12477 [Halotydeus destructor]|nr:hypothetical protein HDE_12477 [Halotydeus destructor]